MNEEVTFGLAPAHSIDSANKINISACGDHRTEHVDFFNVIALFLVVRTSISSS